MEASGSSSSSPGNSQDHVNDSGKVKPQKAPKIPKRLTKGKSKKKSSTQNKNPNPDPLVPDSPPNPTLKKSAKKLIKKPVAASKRKGTVRAVLEAVAPFYSSYSMEGLI